MLCKSRFRRWIQSSTHTRLIVFLTIVLLIIAQSICAMMKINDVFIAKRRTITNVASSRTREGGSLVHNSTHQYQNRTLETTVQCVGPLYNQSCSFSNLYYFNSAFIVLTVKGRHLPFYSVRISAFGLHDFTPRRQEFATYAKLEKFVRNLPGLKLIPAVTVYFGQLWHFNIGHALFDGLYPAYLALMRFAPRHLQSFRILANIKDCQQCWSEDVYSRFAGLGMLKQHVLNGMSRSRWFVFDEVVMGSGHFCQRCVRPNLQLPGGVEMDGSRLFRDRMYRQHGLIPSVARQRSSAGRRASNVPLQAYVIHNKRFTKAEQEEIHNAIKEINDYTRLHLNTEVEATSKLEWPLINVTYMYYGQVKAQPFNASLARLTSVDSRSPVYELTDNNFTAQLRLLQQMDIHITGPGTGQMYQTFLSDGAVTINLGSVRTKDQEKSDKAYTSYMEQHMTAGTPYIKGLYYPINKRVSGIKKDEVVKLIRRAGELIRQGFTLPVDPLDNLAPDGQIFVEMCKMDTKFCSLVTVRLERNYACIDFWSEDFVHESKQWREGGVLRRGRNVSCTFNRTLLHELRNKYKITYEGSIN